ncbi:hypothetical protein CR970_00275 [Candidatus Saccharibacteria bacterium]|nr:MAG: hypothetical protein CR970_00275 [Candidatus Saccharibacteria bacterium]
MSLRSFRLQLALGVAWTASALIVVAYIITISGAGTVYDSRTGEGYRDNLVAKTGANAVSSGASAFYVSTQSGFITTGRTIYDSCRSISEFSTASGKAVWSGTSAVAIGAKNLTASTLRNTAGIVGSIGRAGANAAGFVVRIPTQVASAAANTSVVSNIIRPSETMPTPMLSQTSLEAIDQLNDQERQRIEAYIDSQLAANKSLVHKAPLVGNPNRGGYPDRWNNIPKDSQLDDWGMYVRECVSYTAWKVHQTHGNMPYWGGVGNANQWPRNARRAGIPTGTEPRVGSVAISMSGYYGHAMWVEQVNGHMIYVSQYNWDLRGHYSEMWLDGRNFTYIYF